MERLEKLQLIVRDTDMIQPMPALARFALGEAKVRETLEGQPRASQPTICSDRHERPARPRFLAQSEKTRTADPDAGCAGKPQRLGLVELFPLRQRGVSGSATATCCCAGNNGTGKSKVLSLTLPFLLDAQLKPSRIEPDGDNGKKMSWNLLMNS